MRRGLNQIKSVFVVVVVPLFCFVLFFTRSVCSFVCFSGWFKAPRVKFLPTTFSLSYMSVGFCKMSFSLLWGWWNFRKLRRHYFSSLGWSLPSMIYSGFFERELQRDTQFVMNSFLAGKWLPLLQIPYLRQVDDMKKSSCIRRSLSLCNAFNL